MSNATPIDTDTSYPEERFAIPVLKGLFITGLACWTIFLGGAFHYGALLYVARLHRHTTLVVVGVDVLLDIFTTILHVGFPALLTLRNVMVLHGPGTRAHRRWARNVTMAVPATLLAFAVGNVLGAWML